MDFVIKVDDDFTFDVYEEEEEEAQKSSGQNLDFRIKEEIGDFDFEDNYYFDQKFTKLIDVKTELEPNEEREDEDEEDREIEILRFDNETSLDSLPNLNEENEEMMNIVNSLMNEETSSLLSQHDLTNSDEIFQTIDSPFSNLNIADFDTPLFEELDLTTDNVLTETNERNDNVTDDLELSENSVANLFKIVDVRSCAIEETSQNASLTNQIEENVTVDNQLSNVETTDFDTSSSKDSTGAKKRRIGEEISSPLFEEDIEDILQSSNGDENVDSSTNCGVKKRKIEDTVENQISVPTLVVEENLFDNNVKSLEVSIVDSVNGIEEMCLNDKIEENVNNKNYSSPSEENVSDACVEDVQMLGNLIVNVSTSQGREGSLKSSILESEISSSVVEENVFDSTVKSLDTLNNDLNNTEEKCLNKDLSDEVESNEDILSLLEKEIISITSVEDFQKSEKIIINVNDQNQENNQNSSVNNTEETCLNNSSYDKIEEKEKKISENLIVNVNDGQGHENNLKSSLFDYEKDESSCGEVKKRKIEDRNENQSNLSSSVTEENVFDNIFKSFEAVNCTENMSIDKSLSDKIDENINNDAISSLLENASNTHEESGQTSEYLIDNVNDCENDPKSSLFDNENFESLCFGEIGEGNQTPSGISSSEIEENSFDNNVKLPEDSNVTDNNVEEVRQDNGLTIIDEESKNDEYISSPSEEKEEERITDTCVESVELSENLTFDNDDCQNQISNENVETSSYKVMRQEIEDQNVNQNEISSLVSEENTIFDSSVKSSEILVASTEEKSSCHDSCLMNEYEMEEANVKSSKPTENVTDNADVVSNIDNETVTLSTEEEFEDSSLTVNIEDDRAIVTSNVKEETAVVDDSCQMEDKSAVFENKENVPDSPVNNNIEIKADVKSDFDTSVKQTVDVKSSVRVKESTKKVPPDVVKSVISDRPNEVSNSDKPQTSKICQNVKSKPTPNNASSLPNRFNNGSKKIDFKPSRNSFKSRNNNMATRQGHRYVGNTDRSRFRQFPRPNFNRNVNNFQNNVYGANNSFNNCQNLQNWQCYNIILNALKTLIFQRNYQNMVNSAQNVSTQFINQYCQQQQQNLLDFQQQQSRVQNGNNQRLVFDSVSFNFRRQNVRENNFRKNPTISKTFSFQKKKL